MSALEVRYEYLRPEEIRERRIAGAVAYLPLGTLEWHGPHNPVGLDGLKAHELCCRAAREAGGLVFPVVWYGEHRESHLMEINENVGSQIVDRMGLSSERFSPGYTRSGAIFQQAQDYLALLWKIANQVHALGFEAVIFFNGHYPLSHYGRFLEHLVQRHLKMRTWAGHEGDLLAEAGDPGHGDHAGKWETSLMMAVDDSRVRLDALREADEFIGCGTDALESSREHGEEWARRIVCALADKARALLHH
jgi:creatinine amidohydrolase